MLKKGEPANADVLYLQNKLGVNPTGPFGPKTHAAVVAFQASKGLTADGIVGPKTWGLLG
jgi:peptidoglycan hydrolase-like protein with peptidoglycan-binding domain